MLGPHCYQTAVLDAALVNGLAGKTREPFWTMAYTCAIRWVRTALALVGAPEPALSDISAVLASDADLDALVKRAVEVAPRPPEALGSAPWFDPDVSSSESRRFRSADAVDLDRWYRDDWLLLDPRLRDSLLAGLACVASSPILIHPLSTEADLDPVPVGRRSGCWSRWDLDSLPMWPGVDVREAAAGLRSGPSGRRPAPVSAASGRLVPRPPPAPVPVPGSLLSVLSVLRVAAQQVGAAVAGLRSRPSPDSLSALDGAGPAGARVASVQHAVAALIERALEVDVLLSRLVSGVGGSASGVVVDQVLLSVLARPSRSLSGLAIVFVGRLTISRAEAVRRAEGAGARCPGTVSARTDLVVLGDVSRARRMHAMVLRRQAAGTVDVIDEEQFDRSCSLPAVEGAPAPP